MKRFGVVALLLSACLCLAAAKGSFSSAALDNVMGTMALRADKIANASFKEADNVDKILTAKMKALFPEGSIIDSKELGVQFKAVGNIDQIYGYRCFTLLNAENKF